MVCAQPFDSFDESQLGAFMESPLGVRAGEGGDGDLYLFIFKGASIIHCIYQNEALYDLAKDAWDWLAPASQTIPWPAREKMAVRGVYSWHRTDFDGHNCPVKPAGAFDLSREQEWMDFPNNSTRDSGAVLIDEFYKSGRGLEFDAFARDGITKRVILWVTFFCTPDSTCLSSSSMLASRRRWADSITLRYPDLELIQHSQISIISEWTRVCALTIAQVAISPHGGIRDDGDSSIVRP